MIKLRAIIIQVQHIDKDLIGIQESCTYTDEKYLS